MERGRPSIGLLSLVIISVIIINLFRQSHQYRRNHSNHEFYDSTKICTGIKRRDKAYMAENEMIQFCRSYGFSAINSRRSEISYDGCKITCIDPDDHYQFQFQAGERNQPCCWEESKETGVCRFGICNPIGDIFDPKVMSDYRRLLITVTNALIFKSDFDLNPNLPLSVSVELDGEPDDSQDQLSYYQDDLICKSGPKLLKLKNDSYYSVNFDLECRTLFIHRKTLIKFKISSPAARRYELKALARVNRVIDKGPRMLKIKKITDGTLTIRVDKMGI